MRSQMSRVFLFVLIASVGALTIPAALAHHSNAGFSPDLVTEISGTVKEFQFRNPHSWIQVNVTDPSGKVTEWSIEWGSPNQLGREGIRISTFAPGMKVSIKLHPILNGSPVGGFIGAKMADGKIIGKWDGGE
jgi:uncharacterized protein DUF6152